MIKFIPEVVIPAKEIDNCADCPFFKGYSGWDGEYYCEKLMIDMCYGDALEEIHVACPLITLDPE